MILAALALSCLQAGDVAERLARNTEMHETRRIEVLRELDNATGSKCNLLERYYGNV